MKLIILLVLMTIAVTRGRKIIKCGPVDSKCLKAMYDGSCPRIPFCPTGLKRKWTSKGCCCVLRDSYLVKTVVPEIVKAEKGNILSRTLSKIYNSYDIIKQIFDKNEKLSNKNFKTINKVASEISKAIKDGINDLAVLVDIESEIIFKCIFEEVKVFENKRIELIIIEANEIYEKGNELIEKLSVMIEGRGYV